MSEEAQILNGFDAKTIGKKIESSRETIAQKHLEAIAILVNRNAEIGQELSEYPIKDSNESIVKIIVDRLNSLGFNVEVVDPLSSDFNTKLHITINT